MSVFLERRSVGSGDGVPVVLGGAGDAEGSEAGVFGGSVQRSDESLREGVEIKAGNGLVGTVVDFPIGRKIVGNDGESGGHGLADGNAPALLVAGREENFRLLDFRVVVRSREESVSGLEDGDRQLARGDL